MKKVILLTGVSDSGYGSIEVVQENDINSLLRAIYMTDKGQTLAIVIDEDTVVFYTIDVNRTSLPFRSI